MLFVGSRRADSHVDHNLGQLGSDIGLSVPMTRPMPVEFGPNTNDAVGLSSLDHLAGQADDFHKILFAKLAGHGAENARAARMLSLSIITTAFLSNRM
jgi:hypothetical protein